MRRSRRGRPVAKHSGICPLCSTYIRASQSEIARLPEPIVPRIEFDAEGRCYSFDTGYPYNPKCTAPRATLREWAHRDCVPLWEQRLAEGRENEPLWKGAPAGRRHGGNSGDGNITSNPGGEPLRTRPGSDVAPAVISRDEEWIVQDCPYCRGRHVHDGQGEHVAPCNPERTYRVVDKWRLIAPVAA